MTRQELFEQIKKKQTYLCVGLDTDINKIPKYLLKYPDPVFEFNRQIIDATKDYCVAFKPNVAFYEALGPKGWESLQKTQAYIGKDLFNIADAKRGDIGNTSELYARTFFEQMDFDALTVAPYMGKDSVTPFLNFKNKWVILLAHTSNDGSQDFQLFGTAERKLYQEVIIRSQQWASKDNMMYVVGATRADKIGEIRSLATEYFFLVPGIGAQGGDLNEVSKYGMNKQCGLLVNSSRSIIYASGDENFAEAARMEAQKISKQMGILLDLYL
jgi:orotidine-5'-phosphate decarboxylase